MTSIHNNKYKMDKHLMTSLDLFSHNSQKSIDFALGFDLVIKQA